jgi:hypothetical protein
MSLKSNSEYVYHYGCSMPADSDLRWLYALFIAIDANFRLKRRAVSKDSVDPSLSQGWAYFVEETAYKSYLEANSSKAQEVSHRKLLGIFLRV